MKLSDKIKTWLDPNSNDEYSFLPSNEWIIDSERLEAEIELLKQCREYDAGNAKRPDGYIVVDSETAKRIDDINN